MTEIRPDLSVSRNLLEQIRQRAQDGNISKEELTELRDIARSDSAGMDSNEERLLNSLDADQSSSQLVNENVQSFKKLSEFQGSANEVNFSQLKIKAEKTGVWSSITSIGGLLGRGNETLSIGVSEGNIPRTENPSELTTMAERRATEAQNLNDMLGPLETELRGNSPELQSRLAASMGIDIKAPNAQQQIENRRNELLADISNFKRNPSSANFNTVNSNVQGLLRSYNQSSSPTTSTNMTGPYMTALRTSLYNMSDLNSLAQNESQGLQTRGAGTPENAQALNTSNQTLSDQARAEARTMLDNTKGLITSLDNLRAQGPDAFKQTMGNFTEQDLDVLKAQVAELEGSLADGKPISQSQMRMLNGVWASMSQISNQSSFSAAQEADLSTEMRASLQSQLDAARATLNSASPENRAAAQAEVDAVEQQLKMLPEASQISEQARSVLTSFNRVFASSEGGTVQSTFTKLESAVKESSLTMAQLDQAQQILRGATANPSLTAQQRATANQQLAAVELAKKSLAEGKPVEFANKAQETAFNQVMGSLKAYSSQPVESASTQTETPAGTENPATETEQVTETPETSSGTPAVETQDPAVETPVSRNETPSTGTPVAETPDSAGGAEATETQTPATGTPVTDTTLLSPSGFTLNTSPIVRANSITATNLGLTPNSIINTNLGLTPTSMMLNPVSSAPFSSTYGISGLSPMSYGCGPSDPFGMGMPDFQLTSPWMMADDPYGYLYSDLNYFSMGELSDTPAGTTEPTTTQQTQTRANLDNFLLNGQTTSATGVDQTTAPAETISPENQAKIESLTKIFNSLPPGQPEARSLILAAKDELQNPGSRPELPAGTADAIIAANASLTTALTPTIARELMATGLADLKQTGDLQAFNQMVSGATAQSGDIVKQREQILADQQRRDIALIQQRNAAASTNFNNRQDEINAIQVQETIPGGFRNDIGEILKNKPAGTSNSNYVAGLSNDAYRALGVERKLAEINQQIEGASKTGGNAAISPEMQNLMAQRNQLMAIQSYRGYTDRSVANIEAATLRLNNQLGRTTDPLARRAIETEISQLNEMKAIFRRGDELSDGQIAQLGVAAELRVVGDYIAWYAGTNNSQTNPTFAAIYRDYQNLLSKGNFTVEEIAAIRHRLAAGESGNPPLVPPQGNRPPINAPIPDQITGGDNSTNGEALTSAGPHPAPTHTNLGANVGEQEIRVQIEQRAEGRALKAHVDSPTPPTLLSVSDEGITIQGENGPQTITPSEYTAIHLTNPANQAVLAEELARPDSFTSQVVARMRADGTMTPAIQAAMDQAVAAASANPGSSANGVPPGLAGLPGENTDQAVARIMGLAVRGPSISSKPGDDPTQPSSEPDPMITFQQDLLTADPQSRNAVLDSRSEITQTLAALSQDNRTLTSDMRTARQERENSIRELLNVAMMSEGRRAGIPPEDLSKMAGKDPQMDAKTQAIIDEANRLEAELDIAPMPSVSGDQLFGEWLTETMGIIRNWDEATRKIVMAQIAKQMMDQVINTFYKDKLDESSTYHENQISNLRSHRTETVQQERSGRDVQSAENSQAVAAQSGLASSGDRSAAFNSTSKPQSVEEAREGLRDSIARARSSSPPLSITVQQEEQIMSQFDRIMEAAGTPGIEDDRSAALGMSSQLAGIRRP